MDNTNIIISKRDGDKSNAPNKLLVTMPIYYSPIEIMNTAKTSGQDAFIAKLKIIDGVLIIKTS